MLYEIDFLPVGEGERSGDAICLRYSLDEGDNWYIGVIDGGTKDSGEALCEHIGKYYGTGEIDFLICSHPDQDHASGLSQVLETLTVKKVLMHCPWDYVDDIHDRISDGRVTKQSLRKKLIDGHPYAYKVYEFASENNIPIFHAFSDTQEHGVPCLTIAGPSYTFYLDQLSNFRSICDITEDQEQASLFKALLQETKKVFNWVSESWDDEKLVDPVDDATSSENNSGTILMFDFSDKKNLFTADAGVNALVQAADYLEDHQISLKDFSLVQAPHHGSKRNVGPSILNRLIGTPMDQGSTPIFTVMISAAKDGEPKHPNKRVVNAFTRRGGKVITTQGSAKYHYSPGMPPREGWITAQPLPFYTEVEVEEDEDDI